MVGRFLVMMVRPTNEEQIDFGDRTTWIDQDQINLGKAVNIYRLKIVLIFFDFVNYFLIFKNVSKSAMCPRKTTNKISLFAAKLV